MPGVSTAGDNGREFIRHTDNEATDHGTPEGSTATDKGREHQDDTRQDSEGTERVHEGEVLTIDRSSDSEGDSAERVGGDLVESRVDSDRGSLALVISDRHESRTQPRVHHEPGQQDGEHQDREEDVEVGSGSQFTGPVRRPDDDSISTSSDGLPHLGYQLDRPQGSNRDDHEGV